MILPQRGPTVKSLARRRTGAPITCQVSPDSVARRTAAVDRAGSLAPLQRRVGDSHLSALVFLSPWSRRVEFLGTT
ncbi:uncharacterized protein TRAVEDRAFT_31433 [Trametes versicolor FP-101664 SS1]|uniref:uncharacterized protein n=1 Tax=Trametes versicolor (strain FP-101664) TaxID=717944 RepID=UPI0004622950|nr:uncharacterized protein TRAVEDRAFT_31433 [Trametes versicolor FP-101664 SS1]EIW53155.1 hypothetical protein TRAVEDRAFT_31433 [Trametes versicolor FP-101664 SS1]